MKIGKQILSVVEKPLRHMIMMMISQSLLAKNVNLKTNTMSVNDVPLQNREEEEEETKNRPQKRQTMTSILFSLIYLPFNCFFCTKKEQNRCNKNDRGREISFFFFVSFWPIHEAYNKSMQKNT